MGKNNKLLYKMILTALFSALSFVGVYIKIQLPAGMIHLGNFICVIASLLCGGLIGGISGALGMGLADIAYYGGFSAGVVRTLILKFMMGMIIGYSFRFLLKRKWNLKVINIGLTILFCIAFALAVTGCALGGIDVSQKHIDIHYTVPIFLGLVVVLFILVLLFDHKLNRISKVALTAVALGILFNMFGEIYIKALLYYWIESKYTSFDAAYLYALSSLPSVAITAGLTCILSAIIFYPLYNATKGYLKYDDISEE